ncbi:ATP12 family protein [Qipengyuania sp. XHP0207]|uniref:ATP12 family chaperone protein n=1 Tax=Qipengyuania sp. XHP0207 TaxID=3038078 RepID=UPI00241D98CE|nr:ATP12 family protein [Qipengyuania sp. XHP0207]MDG5749099.1 ATP12 family protein [Qipengyuania sp. XHP0207]
MKRFYKQAKVEHSDPGYFVTLDGRPIKTQGGQPQVVPTLTLAERMAAEWQNQSEELDPQAFVFRDMVDYALDVLPTEREATVEKLLRYAETDTLCYRADPDEPLWHRQRDVWEPMLGALENSEGIRFERVSGVVHRPHPKQTMDALRMRIERLDPFQLAALEQLTSLSASLCVGLAALEDGADGEKLWDAANLEEDWQVEQWGADEEASARREKCKRDFLNAMEFATAARGR